MTAPALDPEVAAQHRAMPLTRLVDCGMDHHDATQLLARTAAGERWEDVAADLGEAQHTRSLAAEAADHLVTAREAARHATAAFLFAQMARNRDDDVKVDRYRRYVRAQARAAVLSDPPVERWELPHRGGLLTGWLCLPPAGRARGTVVVWGGLSGWGAAYLSTADALNRRGLACVLAEGPGQGESRIEHGIHLDADVAGGFGRFLDAVHADPRLDDRIGIQGNSFGGLFAATLAASDHRVDAVVINGAPPTPVVPTFRAAREQILAIVGTDDAETATGVLDALAFDGRRTPITAPVLVLHGGMDPLVTEAEQRAFLVGADPGTSQIVVWPDGEHTAYNHARERDALTADWFSDHL